MEGHCRESQGSIRVVAPLKKKFSTGHSERNKVTTNICLILNCYRDRSLCIYKLEGIGKSNVVTLLTANFIIIFKLFLK